MRIASVYFLLLRIGITKAAQAFAFRALPSRMHKTCARIRGYQIDDEKHTNQSWLSSRSALVESSDENANDRVFKQNTTNKDTQQSPGPRKHHTLTVCMVPHPSETEAWEKITMARTQLRDPGLFRWPPHVNLLYPFVDIKPTDGSSVETPKLVRDDVVDRLRAATEQCEPFDVTLDRLGCFGGAKRGVLWFYPTSHRHEAKNEGTEPLIELQSLLEEQFPECQDQNMHGEFNPHMTISHFPNLDESNQAQGQIEEWWPKNLTFRVDEIYLLERKGDDDQFLRVASLRLGKVPEMGNGTLLHVPAEPFPMMPSKEEDWVRQERMTMKERRRGNGSSFSTGRGRRQPRAAAKGGDNQRRSPSKDSTQEIEAKRAARKAKRDAVEQQAAGLSGETE